MFPILAVLSGCSTGMGVLRATPTELRAAPGSAVNFDSTRPYHSAYRKTLEQMNACLNQPAMGPLKYYVFGDESATEAQVSWAMSAVMSPYRVLATAVLSPTATGTRVGLYWFAEKHPAELQSAMQRWLDIDATDCPVTVDLFKK